MNRSFERAGAVAALSLLVLMLGACGQGDEPPASDPGATALPGEPSGPAHPNVSAAVAKVIGDAHHPRLTWPNISDVAPALETLYDAEPDRLFWFAGEEAYALGEEARLGSLATGMQGDISVLELKGGDWVVYDVLGASRKVEQAFVPVLVVKRGQVFEASWGPRTWGWDPDQA